MTSNERNLPAIAVVGSGYWGKNLKQDYPDIEVCCAYNDVLSRANIQGVVIATPAETHYNLAREALLAGKHVYVEKPLVLEEAEAEELIDLAQKRSRILMVGHLLQYHPVFVKLKEMTANGELGRINYIYSHRLNLGKIRREENILWSFAPHDISMILALAGEEPERVFATGGNYLHQRIADVTTTHMEFSSGLRAHIFVSWLHPFKEQKLVVVGDRKMAVFDDTQPWKDKLLLFPHVIEWKNNAPVPTKAEPERPDIPEAEPLRLECENFLQSILSGLPPITDGHEGLRVLRILKASQRSLDIGNDHLDLKADSRTDTISASPHVKDTFPKDYAVHETAIIDSDCEIGAGTKIWHFSHIISGTRIGQDCNIGQNVVIGPDVTIGNRCKIQNNVSVYRGVTLEDGVFCGPSMVFTNVYNPRAEITKMDQLRPTLVKKGATIGANATILCGVTIGRYAFIGAGAVVTRDIPDHALVYGNPSRYIGWVCECGEKLDAEYRCKMCCLEYTQTGTGGLQPTNRGTTMTTNIR